MHDWVITNLSKIVGASDRKKLPALVAQCLEQRSIDGIDYYRVTESMDSLSRGMLVTAEAVVADYPRIRRVFHLTHAITKYYYSPFYVEQLVPGYHARFVRLQNRTIAFTRGGRACPFTTDRAGDLVPAAFFEENPGLILCMAVSGVGTPYSAPAASGSEEDLQGWAVDLLERDVKEPLSPEQKYAIFDRYELAAVPHAGPFTAEDLEPLRAWVGELDAQGATGVVLKPSDRRHRPLKYATPSELLCPLPVGAWLALQGAASDPCLQRLLRAAFSLSEFRQGGEEIDWQGTGKMLLEPFLDALHQLADGEGLRQERSVWVHEKEAAEKLLAHLRQAGSGVKIEPLDLQAEEGGWRLRFVEHYSEATAALAHRLSGASYLD